MSCEKATGQAGQTAGKSGIGKTSSKAAFLTGGTGQVSFFSLKRKGRPKRKATSSGRTGSDMKGQSPREAKRAKARRGSPDKETASQGQIIQTKFADLPSKLDRKLPSTQRRIKLSAAFSPEELQRLSIQLRLGAAAVTRHIREVSSGAARGLGHSDPRPLDWAVLDQEQYQFLLSQLTEARRGRGYMDASSLKQDQLVELWQFARFEADRAHRNIDHLNGPGNPVKSVGSSDDSPTAHYLAAGHTLEARFYSFLADQIEPMLLVEALQAGEIYEGIV